MSDHRSHRLPDLMAALLGPSGPELTCEECFEDLDRFVELELSGQDADTLVVGMWNHLKGCPACCDDHEALLAFIADREGPS